jgi:hypothetical protein
VLTAIKLLHTVIWAFLAGCILALPVVAPDLGVGHGRGKAIRGATG